jgi:hypothetical protein
MTPTQEKPGFTRPGRRRRQLLHWRSAALAAVITCAAGFYAGIDVEKGQLASSTATGASPTAAGRTGAAAAGTAGAGTASHAGFPSAGRLAGGGGNASVGTVSSVNGNTIDISDSSGNTVKVSLSSSTKISKSQGVPKTAVRPGDSIVIQGVKSSSGTLVASSVSDSGNSANTGASTSSSSGSSSGA